MVCQISKSYRFIEPIWAWRTAGKWRAVQWGELRQTEKAKLEIQVRFHDKLTTVEV